MMSENLQKLFFRVGIDNPVHAYKLSYAWGGQVDTEPDNNVASAMYRRAYLVKLVYSEYTFVLAVATIEIEGSAILKIETKQQAVDLARKRARAVFKADELGYLIDSSVRRDSAEAREELGVSGPRDRIEYSDRWTNAA